MTRSRIRPPFPVPRPPPTPHLLLLLDIPFPKAKPRMKNVQHQHRKHHHGALERDEQLLVSNQVTRPALSQLDDPKHGARKDANGRKAQRKQESSKLGTRS